MLFKIISLSLLSILCSISNASENYNIKIGLTSSHGGGLPDNSINFSNFSNGGGGQIQTPPVEECKMIIETHVWVTTAGLSTTMVLWDGQELRYNLSDTSATEFTYNGYKYRRGVTETTVGPRKFSICRTQL